MYLDTPGGRPASCRDLCRLHAVHSAGDCARCVGRACTSSHAPFSPRCRHALPCIRSPRRRLLVGLPPCRPRLPLDGSSLPGVGGLGPGGAQHGAVAAHAGERPRDCSRHRMAGEWGGRVVCGGRHMAAAHVCRTRPMELNDRLHPTGGRPSPRAHMDMGRTAHTFKHRPPRTNARPACHARLVPTGCRQPAAGQGRRGERGAGGAPAAPQRARRAGQAADGGSGGRVRQVRQVRQPMHTRAQRQALDSRRWRFR